MNVKKTIAGLAAGVVAISAMAVTVSAKEITQAADTKTWNYTAKTYQAKYDTTVAGQIGNITGTEATGATLQLEFSKAVTDVKISVTGLVGSATTATTETFDLTDKTDKDLIYTLDFVKDGEAATSKQVLPSKYTKITDVKIVYTLTDGTKYSSKSNAQKVVDADATKYVTPTIVVTGASAATTDFSYIVSDLLAKSDVDGTTTDVQIKSAAGSVKENDVSGFEVKGEALQTIKNSVDIVDFIGNKKGATLTFSFKEIDGVEDGTGFKWNDFGSAVAKFGVALNAGSTYRLQSAKAIDASALTATFDWDSLVSGSGLAINAIGLANISVGTTEGKLEITSVKVDVPAKVYTDIAAGEDVKDSASEIVTTAPVVTEATTTAAATNPKTGNAPIALAVIPVAIAAAAIIAKKRG